VALQVDAAEPGNVAEQRQVEADDAAEEGGILDERRDAVVGRGCVRRSAVVPVGAVDGTEVGHAPIG
jgi:hypothetical protein